MKLNIRQLSLALMTAFAVAATSACASKGNLFSSPALCEKDPANQQCPGWWTHDDARKAFSNVGG